MAVVVVERAVLEDTLAHAMHDDRAVYHLGDGGDSGHGENQHDERDREEEDKENKNHGGENLRNSEREDDVEGRSTASSRRGDDDYQEVDNPDKGLDHGGDEVEGGLEFAGSEEADFDKGQEEGYACYGYDDGAAGSVLLRCLLEFLNERILLV